MQSIISAARAELKSLEIKRDKLLKIIALAEQIDDSRSSPKTSTEPAATAQPQSTRPAPASTNTYEAVRSILKRRGGPVRLSELLKLVTEMGVTVGGKNPSATLAARLSNSKEFVTHRGIGWWFVDEPLPDSLSIFEGAEGQSAQEQPSASNQNQGQQRDAAALD